MNFGLLTEAEALIGDATPLRTDCGRLCSAACCAPGTENAGVWLLEGEESISMDWGEIKASVYPVAQKPVRLLMCHEMCRRDARPFMCRIFPLTPYFSKKRQEWDVRMDRRAAPVCPLFNYGIRGLDPEFTESVRRAIRLLAGDPDWEKVLETLYAEEAVYHMDL